MRIKYMTDEAIDTIHPEQAMKRFFEGMKTHQENADWIQEMLGFDPFSESKYDVDFKLSFDPSAPRDQNEIDNAIGLYEAFEKAGIPRVVVFQEKFLVGYILTQAYQYFIWKTGLDQISKVKADLFFSTGPRRAIAFNVVGRLYMWTWLSKDETLSDPYTYTRFLFENPSLKDIIYHPYADGENVRLGFLWAFYDWKRAHPNDPVTRKMYRDASIHLSLLCNINCAESMQKEEIKNYLLDFLNAHN